MERDGVYEPFEIRGVDLGVAIPGEWATDFAIDEETYLRWFQMISDLGANTIRVYTILHDDFYTHFTNTIRKGKQTARSRSGSYMESGSTTTPTTPTRTYMMRDFCRK